MSENQSASNEVTYTVSVNTETEPEIDWTPSDMRLSPSKINCFLQCPRQFYYKYIEKLPDQLTLHLFRGTIVHEILEDIFEKEFKYPSRWRNAEPQEWAVLEFNKNGGLVKRKCRGYGRTPTLTETVWKGKR